jgi:hypothetical protein
MLRGGGRDCFDPAGSSTYTNPNYYPSHDPIDMTEVNGVPRGRLVRHHGQQRTRGSNQRVLSQQWRSWGRTHGSNRSI